MDIIKHSWYRQIRKVTGKVQAKKNCSDLFALNLKFDTNHTKFVVCDRKCVFPIHSHCPNRKSQKLIN